MRPAAQKLQDYMADPTNKAPPRMFSSDPFLALTRGLRRLGFVQVKFADPSVPIVSNVTARPITQAGELLDLEVKQVTDAVQWLDSIRLLAYPATAAASSEGPTLYMSDHKPD
jgi:malonyl CoA-acyl carrier protein transacylase